MSEPCTFCGRTEYTSALSAEFNGVMLICCNYCASEILFSTGTTPVRSRNKKPQNPNLFISYSREDKDKVAALDRALTMLGFNVAYDKNIMIGGERHFWSKILDEIQACDVFIFAYSAASNASKYCHLEYTWANDLHRYIIPVLIQEDFSINYADPDLKDFQKKNCLNYVKGSADEFVHMLHSIVTADVPSLPNPVPPRPEEPLNLVVHLNAMLQEAEISNEILTIFETQVDRALKGVNHEISEKDLCYLLRKYLLRPTFRTDRDADEHVRRTLEGLQLRLKCS